MRGLRGTTVALALLLAALAAVGCGLGPGAAVGPVELTVTREYGAVPMLRRSLEAKESDTVMRLLERSAEIETRYGGGFVHSIDGIAEGERGGDPYDWFFYVDGTESPVGAAEVDARGGERIWWDYRDWAATNHVPAVVGSWPAPFVGGVGGERYPVVVECAGADRPHRAGADRPRDGRPAPPLQRGDGPGEARGEACATVLAALAREGVRPSAGAAQPAIRVLVGPWDRLRTDPAARLVEAGPAESGVFADFRPGGAGGAGSGSGQELVALDERGAEARRLGPGAGLVAATSRYGGPPVWFVTGGTPAAVRAAARALDAGHLRDHYAVAIEGGKETPLPVEGR